MKAAITILTGFAALVVFGCSNEGDGFLARILNRGGSGVPVTVESVVAVDRQGEARVAATVEAAESVDVTLDDDVIVERVIAPEGSRVNAGDPLVRLSETDIAARLAQLRADAKDAQATLEKNAYFLKNRDRLIAEGRIDQAQYDNLESEVSKDEAAVEKLHQDIARMEERSAAPVVASPIAGTVVKMIGAPGLTAPGNRPIATVAKGEGAGISFRIPSPTALQAGQSLRVRFPDSGGETATAQVTSVGTEADAAGHVTVRATLPAGRREKAGARAEVALPSPERRRVFIIPEEALLRERGAFFVFTVSEKVAHKVQVLPAETVDNRVEIVRGIGEDDLVVIKGQDKLTEGTVVDIWRK